ncbi:MAG: DUF2147 domain-containing protein [Chlorobi bacterium]|nr:DUF2147 domain-containing protein [Chlorobiota bacterium]
MKKLILALTLLFSVNLIFAQANKVVGYWLTEDGDSKVKIFKATNGKYYGNIVWLDEPNEEDGTPKIDDENPNEELQTRPIMNLQILKDFKYDEDDSEWNDGEIYDPKTGNTYSCYMWFEGEELHVKGYIGFSFIGRSTVWTKTEL